jgi:hypothetical protein
VAIRNVLAEISQGNMMPRQQLAMLQAAGVNIETLSDKSLTFSDRLKALAPIVNDNAAMVKLFGKENVAAGIALVQNTGEIDRLTGKITGTNSAVTMADTVMGSYQERVNRMKAAISDFGISIFEATKPFMPFITIGMGTIQVMANMAQAGVLFSTIAGSTMVKSIGSFVAGLFVQTAATGSATVAQEGLNVAMSLNPVGFIIVGIAALAAGLVYAYKKSEDFRAGLNGILEVGKLLWKVFEGVGNVIIGAFTMDFSQFKKGLGQVADSAIDIATGGIGKAFDKGVADTHHEALVDKVKAAVDEENKKKEQNITIAGITTQGDANKNSPLAGYDPHNRKGKGEHKTGKEMASNVTAGGSRPTTIYLTIQKVIGIGELKTTNLVGAAKEAGNQVVEEVLMAIQSVNGKVSVQ